MSNRSGKWALCLVVFAVVSLIAYKPVKSFVVMRFIVPHRYASEISTARARGAEVLLLGDSLTAGWRRHSDLWAGVGRVANYGFNGDRPADTERRIDAGDLRGISPNVVVLMIGTNDAGHATAESTVTAVRRIIGRVTSELPGASIILVGVPPRNVGQISETGWATDVNHGLESLASELSVPFVDPSPLAGADGGLKPGLTTDGLHFTRAGYESLAKLLVPVVRDQVR
jgi:lysophospholipase L1-like esterase